MNSKIAKDLLDYQSDAIVSKVLIKKEGGNVSLFAFDKGQELSEHTSPYDALAFIVDGKADISISGEKHQVEANGLLHLPAGQPHALNAVEKFKMLLIMIK